MQSCAFGDGSAKAVADMVIEQRPDGWEVRSSTRHGVIFETFSLAVEAVVDVQGPEPITVRLGDGREISYDPNTGEHGQAGREL